MRFTISGNLADISSEAIYPVEISVEKQKILSIRKLGNVENKSLPYIIPGFIDAHVHIESSMLIPSEFARLAVVHGTVATVSDPHEIANVCGIAGVEYMIENGKSVPFKFNFGAPSCVPATPFETAGASLNAADVAKLLQRDEVKYLSEMMNFPGVLNKDPEVMAKITSAKEFGKPIDGHAPGLRGVATEQYILAGISTDHECFTYEEALEKLNLGMKILIREGSAAKNFEALIPLLNDFPDKVMFCSDDKHPDSLVEGHLNQLCARAVRKRIPIFNILKAACVNPVKHYGLEVGLLLEGDPADFILVENLEEFHVIQTYINGELVANNGDTFVVSQKADEPNNFNCKLKLPEDFRVATGTTEKTTSIPVIEAIDGQLITNKLIKEIRVVDGFLVSDIENDILKIAVVNRYSEAPVSVSFIHNFNLKAGAIASSVAHDSHNIVVVGTDDESIAKAVNLVINERGGVSCVTPAESQILALPVAGLMSTDDGYEVAKAYTEIDRLAKCLGSSLNSPFMTLSFMALLVIPHLKLSDKGLFDGDSFRFIETLNK